jgi:hypothetical protein
MKLDLGTTGHEEGWITVDKLPGADVQLDLLDFDKWEWRNVEEIRTTHFIQELPLHKAKELLNQCFKTLIPGGKITVSVPDFNKYITAYVAGDDSMFINRGICFESRFLNQLMWGGANISFYTVDMLSEILFKIGFSQITPVAPGNRAAESLCLEAYK